MVAIVLAYVAFAAMWVVRVPAFQQPDEMAHADDMFAFFDAGRFYRVASDRRDDEVLAQTQFVADVAGFRRLRYNPFGRLTPEETPLHLLATSNDRGPTPSDRARPAGSAMPYVMFSYPATYYVLLAATARAVTFANPRAIAAFFVARACNVAFGIGTLLLAFSLLRRRLGATTALLATAGIAMLPLFCWVTAYVQPDNLVLFLVTFAVCAARRRTNAVALTGLAVCALCLVKPHYGAVLGIACAPFLLRGTRGPATARAAGMLVLLPVAAIALALSLTPVTGGLSEVGSVAHTFGSTGPRDLVRDGARFVAAVASVYAGGRVFVDYWLGYGIRGFYLSTSATNVLALGYTAAALAATFACLALYARRGVRIARVGASRGAGAAARLVSGGLEINLCILYGAFLIAASVLDGSGLGLQARYWLPIVVPTTLVVVGELPRLVVPGRRRTVAFALASVVLVMTLPVNVVTPNAIERDFYAAPSGAPQYDFGGFALDDSGRDDSFLVAEKRARPGDRLTIRGFALDVETGLPVDHVAIASGNNVVALARNVYWDVPAAEELHDRVVYRGGFVAVVDAARFGPGRHEVSVVVWRGNGPRRPLRHRVTLIVG